MQENITQRVAKDKKTVYSPFDLDYDDLRPLKLKAKEKKFISEYCTNGNNPIAAFKASNLPLSEKNSIEFQAQTLVSSGKIAMGIEIHTRHIKVHTKLTKDYILQVIMDAVDMARVKKIPANIYKGAEMLGKHVGLFAEKVEIDGQIAHVIRLPQKLQQGENMEIKELIALDPKNLEESREVEFELPDDEDK